MSVAKQKNTISFLNRFDPGCLSRENTYKSQADTVLHLSWCNNVIESNLSGYFLLSNITISFYFLHFSPFILHNIPSCSPTSVTMITRFQSSGHQTQHIHEPEPHWINCMCELEAWKNMKVFSSKSRKALKCNQIGGSSLIILASGQKR